MTEPIYRPEQSMSIRKRDKQLASMDFSYIDQSKSADRSFYLYWSELEKDAVALVSQVNQEEELDFEIYFSGCLESVTQDFFNATLNWEFACTLPKQKMNTCILCFGTQDD
jgi:hypothetical protein